MKRSIHILLLMCIALAANAQSSIEGVVRDQAGEPIYGARIQVAGTDIRTCSDESGRYSLASQADYFYTLRVLKNGYLEQEAVIVTGKGRRRAHFALSKSATGTTFSDCRIRTIKASKPYWHGSEGQPPARAGSAIGGLVIDSASAQPLAGVNVSTEPPTASVVTNQNGDYVIYSDVEPGLHKVKARRSGYQRGSATIWAERAKFVKADIALVARQIQSAEGASDWAEDEAAESGSRAEGGSDIEEFDRTEEQEGKTVEGQSDYFEDKD